MGLTAIKGGGRTSGGEVGGFPSGVQSLPRMVACNAYSLHLKQGAGRPWFISTFLSANLGSGAPCALITSWSPQQFLARCDPRSAALFKEAILRKQLLVFTMIGDYRKNLFRFGPEKFLRELEAFGLKDGSMVVVDQAESLFSLHQRELALEQLNAYQGWLRKSRSTAVLLFSQSTESAAQSSACQAVVDNTSGSAQLMFERGTRETWVDFWQSPGGTITGRQIKLEAGGEPVRRTEDESGADDADDVYYLGNELTPASTRKPGRWVRVQGLVGMIHAARDARAATVIITVSADTDLPQLAQAVHALRTASGPMLRIVIRDCGPSIRYQYESMLLSLGANMVIRKDVHASRIPLLLESLRGQLYLRDMKVTFEEALASATPSRIRGYLPPPVFIDEVRRALVRARTLDLPCALIALKHAADEGPATSLRKFALSREGDVLTANAACCYVFLYGCFSVDLHALVPRLVGLHGSGPTADLEYYTDEESIDSALRGLERDHSGEADLVIFEDATPLAIASFEKPLGEQSPDQMKRVPHLRPVTTQHSAAPLSFGVGSA